MVGVQGRKVLAFVLFPNPLAKSQVVDALHPGPMLGVVREPGEEGEGPFSLISAPSLLSHLCRSDDILGAHLLDNQ